VSPTLNYVIYDIESNSKPYINKCITILAKA